MSAEIKNVLLNLIETVNKQPNAANSVFRASSHSEQDSFAVRSQIRDFEVTMDEPVELGGADSGPNPVELLLAALGGCQEIVYRAYAAIMGLRIERIEVHAKGYLDLRGLLNLADVPSGFSKVTFETKIVSDEPEEKIRQLSELVEQHCPVLDTLLREIPVSGKVDIQKCTETIKTKEAVVAETA